jgi:archaellum biogenesis ATPase FlaH
MFARFVHLSRLGKLFFGTILRKFLYGRSMPILLVGSSSGLYYGYYKSLISEGAKIAKIKLGMKCKMEEIKYEFENFKRNEDIERIREESKGKILVVQGENGTGKTCAVKEFAKEEIDRDRAILLYSLQHIGSVEQIFKDMIEKIGVDYIRERDNAINLIQDACLDLVKEGQRPLIVIDDMENALQDQIFQMEFLNRIQDLVEYASCDVILVGSAFDFKGIFLQSSTINQENFKEFRFKAISKENMTEYLKRIGFSSYESSILIDYFGTNFSEIIKAKKSGNSIEEYLQKRTDAAISNLSKLVKSDPYFEEAFRKILENQKIPRRDILNTLMIQGIIKLDPENQSFSFSNQVYEKSCKDLFT